MNLKNYNLPCCFITVIMSYSAAGAEGDIVTIPSYQLGLPDSNYLTVADMVTKAQGGSHDVDLVKKLQKSLESEGRKEDELMHWYVTPLAEGQTVVCDDNSFRLTYEGRKHENSAVAMVVWLPAPASEINVSFETYSTNMSLSVFTYDYGSNNLMYHWSGENLCSNPGTPNTSVTITETITPGRDPNKKGNQPYDAFTGNFLILLFNTTKSEKTWLDINGASVSFVPTAPLADLMLVDLVDEYAYGDVGYNIMSIPEPATTTLSLAALGMLAARRRRR